MTVKKKNPFFKKGTPLTLRLRFWITCWRPATKYELVKLYQQIVTITAGTTLELAKINVKLKELEGKKSDDKGMYG
jgi:hypothetical protein